MKNSVTELDVLDAIKSIEFQKLGKKSTIAIATLENGYEIIESSSCVSDQNYSQEIGEKICRERIISRVWGLLGFLLQEKLYMESK